jgi:superfamily II DNA or RNA helicase
MLFHQAPERLFVASAKSGDGLDIEDVGLHLGKPEAIRWSSSQEAAPVHQVFLPCFFGYEPKLSVASLSLLVSPSGHLRPDPDPLTPATLEEAAVRRIVEAFAAGEGSGLLHLGAAELDTELDPPLAYFRDFARTLIARVCQLAEPERALEAGEPALEEAALGRLLLTLPPMRGAEYASAEQLHRWWAETRQALRARVEMEGTTVESVLHAASPVWNLVGRVHFHLAENRRDPERPFAFLATYTVGVSAGGKVRHAPLGQALREYAGTRNRRALLALLAPVDRASERCAWVRALLDSGALYQPLAWSAAEALVLLRDVEALEAAGLQVRIPEHWARRRPPRATVQVTVGGKAPGQVGPEALLEFDVAVTLEGETLCSEELRELLAGTEDLVLLRGRWVEVDRAGVTRLLERWSEAERVHAGGIPFHEALRLVAGAEVGAEAELLEGAAEARARIVAGPWLSAALEGLRSPEGLAATDPGDELKAELRPYQQTGLRWLWWLRALGLGGCLADDMGLGKTIQAIALFILCRRRRLHEAHKGGNGATAPARVPSLVVAPASLLGNWKAELTRFAPSLEVLVAHASETPAEALAALDPETLARFDVVLTSYGSLQRLPPLSGRDWDVVVADEAQAIKNASTRQARAMRSLRARCRLALSGTPVENRLGDLWSIFAFSNPGLLGTEREFTAFVKGVEKRAQEGHSAGYGPLRSLVGPYILRRLKTQKQIIADLPDKTEVKAFCGLARKQTALYQQAVQALERDLYRSEGVERRGIVLASLTRLKQICNHPSHWLRDGHWRPEESGKLRRLGELVEEIAARQEKMLVFTQFKEITEPLAAFLSGRFGRPGLVLSGDTAVSRRQKLVQQFQAEDGPPFFVLSLRAGGTGLNLTAASHVVHFDRWWNPAVEDQATDRAFRIGQKRNVLVHKLICRGTLEERIDALIEGKRNLSRQVIEEESGAALTELSNEEILGLVSLDLRTAAAEGSS